MERINEDPNDEANIRYGLMSACVITKNSKVAEEVAEKIADVMGKASARFFKENNIKPVRVRKTWLDHLDPTMLYLLAMVNWKVENFNRVRECLLAIYNGPCGKEMLGQFMWTTANLTSEDYLVNRIDLETNFNPFTAEALIVYIDVDFNELKKFNEWIQSKALMAR